VTGLPRGAVFAAFTLAFCAACNQMLDIQDARLDQSLAGGATATNGGATQVAHGGDSSSGGTEVAPGGRSSGESNQAGESGTSTGTNAGAGGEAGAAGGHSGPGPEQTSPCESYCDAVISNCKGKYEQYRTFDQCIEVCKHLPQGAIGDENLNSVECRVRQARFAESEPFVYCKSAGPLGGGKCGSNCVSYCSLMESTCTAASTEGNLERSYFNDTESCLSECNALPADPAGPVQYSSSAIAAPSSFVGNHVFCRTYHVAAALEQDAPTEHCPHAMGGDPCIAQ